MCPQFMIFSCQRKFSTDRVKQARKTFKTIVIGEREIEFSSPGTKGNEGRERGCFS